MPQLRIYDVLLVEYVHMYIDLSENSMDPYSVHLSADLSRLVGTQPLRFWTSGSSYVVYHLNKTTSRTEDSVKSSTKKLHHIYVLFILYISL